MTKQEIVASYQRAKDKSKQIGILAELNACDWQKIADILSEAGIRFQPPKGNNRGKSKPWSQQEKDTIQAMLAQGKSYREIAEMLGRVPSAVRACAIRMRGEISPSKPGTLTPVEEIPIDHLWARRILEQVYGNLESDGKQTIKRGMELAVNLLKGGSAHV